MAEPAPIIGIPELDRELVPYLPSGWLGLLTGRPGSGSALFAKQFAQAAGPHRTPVVFYTTYERTEDIHRAFQEFGWRPENVRIVNLAAEYYERVLRRDLEVSQAREQGLTYRDVERAPPTPVQRRTFNLQNRILSDLATIETPFRLVLDSLDFFLETLAPADAMVVARQVRHLAQARGGDALLVIQADIHERRMAGLLEEMADLVLDLRAEPKADTFEHVLAIRKVRNHPERSRIHTVRATDHGLVLPSSDAAP
jgi:KaiC/GvpD/RAD55 family RecA-like ATPase